MTTQPTQALVRIEGDVPLADSRAVARQLGIDHRSFFKLIVQYQPEIEADFGFLRLEITKTTRDEHGRGRPSSYALLTEDQTFAYMSYSQNTPQARACKRLLVKAFVEARKLLEAGHAQPMAAPRLNRLWEQRLLLFNRQTRIPAGYWCIFNEIAHICWDLEEFRGIQVHERAAPDISVALLWMQEVRRLGLDESLIRRYPHHYPDQRGVQYANMYPNAWLGTFRTWLERQYLPHEFQAYLKTHAVTPATAAPQVPEKTVTPSHTHERKG